MPSSDLGARSIARQPLGYAQLARFVSGPRAHWRIAGLALVLSLPVVGMGLAADDYDMAAAVATDPWSAYSFQPRDPGVRLASLLAARAAGEVPWWTDEHFHQAFMRPLSSLSLALDFGLWPHAVWWMHVESGLLFALSVLLVWSLNRRLFDEELVAGLATFSYATQPGLALNVGWISGRNTLLATWFGLLCFWLYQRAIERGAWWLRLAACMALACSLLSAEIGLSTLAYLVAFEATLSTGGWRARSLRLAPFFAIALGWRVVYGVAGFGAVGSAYYRDPLHDPIGVGWNLITGMPTYLATQLTVPLAGLAVFSERAQAIVAALSLLALALLYPLFARLLRADPRARFCALGALLATLPLGATLPQDRLVSFVALGASGLFALFVRERFGSPPASTGRGANMLFRVRALWVPLGFVPALFVAYGMAAGGGAVPLDNALRDEQAPVVLVNAPSVLPVHHRRVMHRLETGEAPPPVYVLYAGTEPVVVRRVAEHTLELRVAGGFLRSPVSGGVRDTRRAPLRAGDTVDSSGLHVQVLEAQRGDPVRVRFDLRADAGGRAPRVYAWRGREPSVLALPAPGAEIELPGLSLL